MVLVKSCSFPPCGGLTLEPSHGILSFYWAATPAWMKNFSPPRPERKTLRGRGLALYTQAERRWKLEMWVLGSLSLTGREANAKFKECGAVRAGEARGQQTGFGSFAELQLMSGDTRQLGSGWWVCWGLAVCQTSPLQEWHGRLGTVAVQIRVCFANLLLNIRSQAHYWFKNTP